MGARARQEPVPRFVPFSGTGYHLASGRPVHGDAPAGTPAGPEETHAVPDPAPADRGARTRQASAPRFVPFSGTGYHLASGRPVHSGAPATTPAAPEETHAVPGPAPAAAGPAAWSGRGTVGDDMRDRHGSRDRYEDRSGNVVWRNRYRDWWRDQMSRHQSEPEAADETPGPDTEAGPSRPYKFRPLLELGMEQRRRPWARGDEHELRARRNESMGYLHEHNPTKVVRRAFTLARQLAGLLREESRQLLEQCQALRRASSRLGQDARGELTRAKVEHLELCRKEVEKLLSMIEEVEVCWAEIEEYGREGASAVAQDRRQSRDKAHRAAQDKDKERERAKTHPSKKEKKSKVAKPDPRNGLKQLKARHQKHRSESEGDQPTSEPLPDGVAESDLVEISNGRFVVIAASAWDALTAELTNRDKKKLDKLQRLFGNARNKELSQRSTRASGLKLKKNPPEIKVSREQLESVGLQAQGGVLRLTGRKLLALVRGEPRVVFVFDTCSRAHTGGK